MTTIVKDVAAKFAVAIVAVAMIFTMFAPAANAQEQSVEDLQALIQSLMAQINALESNMGGSTAGTGSSAVCPYTWTRDLSQGSTGADVMKLQQFLNETPDLRVAATGAGAPGMETDYYGPATAAAVSKMQVMFRAEVLTPAGLVNPTGYFGPSSRAKANALCEATLPVDDMDDEDEMEDEDEDESEDEDDVELGGVATLDSFEVDEADDIEIEEGDRDVEIGMFTIEFDDGDAEISYLDISLLGDGEDNTTGSTRVEPWEAFEEVSLWVDGDMIASVDADNEDDYLNEDTGTLRFNNLGIIAMEGEEVEIVVAVEVQNNLDSDELGVWDLRAMNMRYFDADGVATTEDNQDELVGGAGGALNTRTSAEFEIVVEGFGEELNFSLSSNNPDATDIIVDTTSRTNDVTIMEYEIEAEDGDIELDTLFVNIVTGTAIYDNVVADIELIIDGQVFRDEAVVGGNSTSATVEFDIDGDIVIDEDDEVTIEVVVDFKAQSGNYANGETIKAQVTTTERDATIAEGGDDISDFSGTAVGDDHTLVAEGIVVPASGFDGTDTETQGQDNLLGIYNLEFEVTAVEGDFYIADFAALETAFGTGGNATSTTGGVGFRVEGPGAPSSANATLSSTADEDGVSGAFIVRDGETETFTLRVTVDASAAGDHRVILGEVWYSEDTDGLDASPYLTTPITDFRSDYETINQL